MNDSELLELAAKAAGIDIGEWFDSSNAFINFTNNKSKPWWNPLNDNGDALQLAVKLNMDISQNTANVWACAEGGSAYEIKSDDQYAATRRAIVRAAAEIGRQ
jgi:hypothetical protein